LYYISEAPTEVANSKRFERPPLEISDVVRFSAAFIQHHLDAMVESDYYEIPEYKPEYIYDSNITQINKLLPYTIALTFDDGPSEVTERILDILEYHDVVATFCVLGSRIARNESTLVRTFEAGHEVVGHSWNHQRYTTLSRSAIREQLVHTNEEIYRVLGIVPTFHRPPYGARNHTVLEVSQELDLAILAWSVDPRDWEHNATVDRIYNHIMDHIFDGSILLFHDVHDVTVYSIEKLVPSLLERGVTFVTASELLSESEYPIEGGRIFRHR